MINLLTDPAPFTTAMKMARDRDVLPGAWDSDTLSALEQALKRRAIFSARTTNADYLQALGKLVDQAVKGEINKAQFRDAAKRLLDEYGYTPAKGFPEAEGAVPPAEEGAITDLASDSRLNLIFDTQVGQAQGWSFYERGQDDSRLWQFPCWELVRVEEVEIPRGEKRGPRGSIVPDPGNDWPSRWEAAGGEFFDGRMIARKDDDVWDALGDGEGGYDDTLGQPFPPFAFNSGMGVREVPREECVEAGVIDDDDEVPVKSRGFNDGVEVDAGKYDPDILRELIRGCDDFLKHGAGKIILENTHTGNIARLTALVDEIDRLILANDFDEGLHPRGERGRFVRSEIAQQIKKGKRALRIARNQKRTMPNAMHRGKYRFDFDYGRPGNPASREDDGYGISHADEKHSEDLRRLPVTLARGSIHQHDEVQKVYAVHGNDVAILKQKPRNDGSWSQTRYGLITHFKDGKTARYASARAVLLEGR